jgi:hypothetical protein
MIKINQSFVDSYHTPGITRDNFIFENCPKEFINAAKPLLSRQDSLAKSCVITFDETNEHEIETALNLFENDYHKKLVARDYVCTLILKELLNQTLQNNDILGGLNTGLDAISKADKKGIMDYHMSAPMPYEITNFYREIAPFELNFILDGNKNIYVQQAINNFISSREPFSVKIFTTKTLPTYLDQNKTPIENPHDYMKRNVQDFIEQLNEKQ